MLTGRLMWVNYQEIWVLPKWAWSGSHEQFLHCGLRKFRHSKSSVDRWYTQLNVVGLFMTLETMGANSIATVECTLSIRHCLRLNLQLHTIGLVRTCRISSFCTVAWQLARFQLTRRIARSLGDSWASCISVLRDTYTIEEAAVLFDLSNNVCVIQQLSKH